MAKNNSKNKISVKLEDEGVVTIKVDNRRYTRLEDIPDPSHRMRAEAMITEARRAEDLDLDSEFGPEFTKRDMEHFRDNARFPTAFVGAFALVALLMLGIAVVSVINAASFLSREISATGVVVALNESPYIARETRANREVTRVVPMYYPVVEFQSVNGKIEHIEVYEGSSSRLYHVGQEVPIQYDPARPANARIPTGDSWMRFWLLPLLTGFLGIVFGAVLVVALILHRKAVKRYEQAKQEAIRRWGKLPKLD